MWWVSCWCSAGSCPSSTPPSATTSRASCYWGKTGPRTTTSLSRASPSATSRCPRLLFIFSFVYFLFFCFFDLFFFSFFKNYSYRFLSNVIFISHSCFFISFYPFLFFLLLFFFSLLSLIPSSYFHSLLISSSIFLKILPILSPHWRYFYYRCVWLKVRCSYEDKNQFLLLLLSYEYS